MEEKASCSSSNPPDEISLFLHHFVLRSSASSSSSPPSNSAPPSSSLAPQPFFHHLHTPPPPHASGDGIPSSGIDPSFAYATAAARASHAPSSSSVGASENEADEYDCGESEEGLEVLLEEVPARPNTSRTSSKRSRTAEVHNLSEKRRRSRINEKMKALQSLIPNSNKTDKASMLDEAIEYLKQLQLQVQMLSIRNGLSLHPMCLPGPIQAHQQMRPLLGEEDNNEHLQHTLHQETPHSQTLFELLERRSEPSIPNIFTSDSPFGFNSSSQNHPAARPFHLHLDSEEICRDDAVRHQQLNINNHSESSLFDKHASYPLPKSELNVGASETLSLPFGSQPSITKTEDPFRG